MFERAGTYCLNVIHRFQHHLNASLNARYAATWISPSRLVRHHPLVPAPSILTPTSALSMPGTLSPYPSWLTATPVLSLMAAPLASARSARRSRWHQPSGFNTSPSHDPFLPQLQPSQHQPIPDISTPTPAPATPQPFQCQRQHQPSNRPNASHLNTCPNANSICPPTISTSTPALPPTVSMPASGHIVSSTIITFLP